MAGQQTVVVEGGGVVQVVEVGIAGPPGPPGPVGPAGPAASHIGAWSWSANQSLPPQSGQMRTNTGNWQAATTIYLADHTADNVDVATWLPAILDAGSQLHVQQKTDSSRWARFDISGPWENQGNYFALAAVWTEGSTTLPGATELRIAFIIPDPLAALEARLNALEARLVTLEGA